MIALAFYAKEMDKKEPYVSLDEDKKKYYFDTWCKWEMQRDEKHYQAYKKGKDKYFFKGMPYPVEYLKERKE